MTNPAASVTSNNAKLTVKDNGGGGGGAPTLLYFAAALALAALRTLTRNTPIRPEKN